MRFDIEFKGQFEIIELVNEYRARVKIKNVDIECDSDKAYLSGVFFCKYPGDIIECFCKYVKDDMRGFSIKALSPLKTIIPSDRDALCKYMSKQIRGVSKTTVERVYDALGYDFIEKLIIDETQLDGINIREEQKKAIISWCKTSIGFNSLSTEFALRGFSLNETIEAYKKYGIEAINILKRNPFTFFYNEICNFRLSNKIYLEEFNISDNKRKNELNSYYENALVYFSIKCFEAEGNMAIKKDNLINYVNIVSKRFKFNYFFTDEAIDKSLNQLFKDRLISILKIKDVEYIFLPKNLIAEKNIAKYLKTNNKELSFNEDHIREKCSEELLIQQKEAIVKCLTHKISILTGGPGTGKTYTIKKMIEVAKYFNPKIRIALMAPTGKAASRMIELINQEALTIHAKLGISENDDLSETDGMKITEDLIIIDEASMIEEALFGYLVNHVSENSQIVLVGDSGQLPSVGAGNLLKELIEIIPSTELKVTKRTGVAILEKNAQNIREKKVNNINYDDSYFSFTETEDIVKNVVDLYKEYQNNVMILSPQYSGPGVDTINKEIQKLNNGVEKEYGNVKFKVGDRVICTKNTKKNKTHNGDQGEIVGLNPKSLIIKFDDQDDPIEISNIDTIKLAYCITVHKSQGSECDNVILVCSPIHKSMLTNKLIYTAVTRSKKHFIGIGNKAIFEQSCKKEEKERISLISELYDEYNLAGKAQEC